MRILVKPPVALHITPRATSVSTEIRGSSRRALAQRLIAVATVSIGLLALSAAPAWSAVTAEQQGASLLAQIQNGQTSCSKLSSSNLALMGEYYMGRIMGSAAGREESADR